MAALIGTISMLTGSIGIFMGFYYLSSAPEKAYTIVSFSTVGVVGVLAFIRHVIFHKSDARRLGWETDRPDWMFEVGFANLAFGSMGIAAAFYFKLTEVQTIVLFGYAIYLLQAAILHGYRYFTDTKKSPARLWRSCISTLVYAGMLMFFALYSMGL